MQFVFLAHRGRICFMLGSNCLSSAFAKYGLLRCLLLVAQLFIVLTSVSVVAECRATALVNHDLCLAHSHIGNYGEHEHPHPQPAALVPFAVNQAALLLTHTYTLIDLLPSSILFDIIKPPPRLG